MTTVRTVAIIGSFRQHYREVCRAWKEFTDVKLEITSPKGAPIIEEGIPFVRFVSDPPDWDNPLVQTVALHRILRADFVFIVAPKGYVGRTTCYEIGRIVQAKRPVYFSEHPDDLPVHVPAAHIRAADQIAELIRTCRFNPESLYIAPTSKHTSLENDLLFGRYRPDDELLP